MAKITVKTNPDYNGADFGVAFVNGVAETEDAWLITMFKEKGYEIHEEPEPKKKAPAKKTTPKEG